VVVHGGNGDGGGVDVKIGGEQLVDGGEDGDGVFGSGVSGAGRIWLDGGNESYTLARQFEFAVDAEMVLAERACAGDG
jgi:hypothetical protein